MTQFRFGGSEFINCSVPLAFEGRYFIVEPGTPEELVSVVLDYNNNPIFEVLKNEPIDNPVTMVSKTPPGILTVTERQSGTFLYKIRPGSETSIVFGTIKGEEITVSVTDRQIKVGTNIIKNCVFNGVGAGVVIFKNGSMGIGAPIPESLRRWFAVR